jgi:hypothetical protein
MNGGVSGGKSQAIKAPTHWLGFLLEMKSTSTYWKD